MNSENVPSVETVLEAGRAEAHYWRDLWRYRELFYFLAWRDILVRYKQTAIGVAWAVLQPAATTAIFCLFGALLRLPTSGVPRPVLVFAGQLPWQFFAASLAGASASVVSNSQLISKVYFPRLLVPLSAIAVSFVDFLVAAGLLALLMIFYRVVPDARILALPLFVGLGLATALGAGLWLTALTVKYRDFRFVLPFIIQFGLYVSPIAFSSDIVPDRWRVLYSLNPMVGVIDGFRWSLLRGSVPLDPAALAGSVAAAIFLLVGGLTYFRATERKFADII